MEEEEGHRNALLIMHTEPLDNEGPQLFSVAEKLGLSDHVVFSRDRLDFEKINVLYNISDFCMNISYAEGFGLATLESMMTGTPIVAVKTGGLTRQVVDHRDGSENGVALDIELKTLVGSQQVPYIYEDYVSCESTAEAMMKLHDLPPDERLKLRKKANDYIKSEFNHQDTIDNWHETMKDTQENWRERYKRWVCYTF